MRKFYNLFLLKIEPISEKLTLCLNRQQMNEAPSGFSRFANRKLLLIGGGVFILLIIGAFLLSNSRDDLRDGLQRLSLRYPAIVKLTNDSAKSIRGEELAKLSSEAGLLLGSDGTSLSAILKDRYGTKIPKEITAAELDTTTKEKLEQAELLDRFDVGYKEVLTVKLESINALLTELLGKTKNAQISNTLQTAQKNTSNLLNQLQKLRL